MPINYGNARVLKGLGVFLNWPQRSKHSIEQLATALCALLFLSACVPSGSPWSEDLIKTDPPTFSGLTNQNFTTPSVAFELVGECDPKSFGLEYSTDQVSWTTITGGCVNGAFKVKLNVFKSQTVYARAITKKGWTSSAKATVRLVMPATSPAFQFVNMSHSEDEGPKSIQMTMSSSIPGEPLEGSGGVRLNSNIVGVVYGQ